MFPKTISQQIHSEIKKAHTILLVSHKNPDGDALGCLTAFSQHLANEKKKHFIYCKDAPPIRYRFLPNIENIMHDVDAFIKNTIHLIIFFDSSNLEHTAAKDFITLLPHTTIINIDHHATNTEFGHINLVVPMAASSTEIIYTYFRHNNIPIPKNIATCLITGILSDTDTFVNHNTTANVLEVCSHLLSKGAQMSLVLERLYRTKTKKSLEQWGKALSRLYFNSAYNIGIAIILKGDIVNNEYEDITEGLPSFLNSLSDVNAILVLKEQTDGTIKGSFRTTNNLIDVSKLAILLGGGGHKKAAGFTIAGRLVEKDGGWKVI